MRARKNHGGMGVRCRHSSGFGACVLIGVGVSVSRSGDVVCVLGRRSILVERLPLRFGPVWFLFCLELGVVTDIENGVVNCNLR